jgi:hypothetical protein
LPHNRKDGRDDLHQDGGIEGVTGMDD